MASVDLSLESICRRSRCQGADMLIRIASRGWIRRMRRRFICWLRGGEKYSDTSLQQTSSIPLSSPLPQKRKTPNDGSNEDHCHINIRRRIEHMSSFLLPQLKLSSSSSSSSSSAAAASSSLQPVSSSRAAPLAQPVKLPSYFLHSLPYHYFAFVAWKVWRLAFHHGYKNGVQATRRIDFYSSERQRDTGGVAKLKNLAQRLLIHVSAKSCSTSKDFYEHGSVLSQLPFPLRHRKSLLVPKTRPNGTKHVAPELPHLDPSMARTGAQINELDQDPKVSSTTTRQEIQSTKDWMTFSREVTQIHDAHCNIHSDTGNVNEVISSTIRTKGKSRSYHRSHLKIALLRRALEAFQVRSLDAQNGGRNGEFGPYAKYNGSSVQNRIHLANSSCAVKRDNSSNKKANTGDYSKISKLTPRPPTILPKRRFQRRHIIANARVLQHFNPQRSSNP